MLTSGTYPWSFVTLSKWTFTTRKYCVSSFIVSSNPLWRNPDRNHKFWNIG